MSVVQQPNGGFNFKLGSTPSPAFNSSLPFTLNAAPSTNPPQSMTGASEYIRNSDASTDTAFMAAYLAESNYTLQQTPTENIIDADPQTTLRFNGVNYTQRFIAIHKNIWKRTSPPQISLFFMTPNNDMFHICIPIEYVTDNSNKYLDAWLNPDSTATASTSELLRFDKSMPDIRFAILSGACLTYNVGRDKSTYTLCMFANSLKLNKSKLPVWLSDDMNFTSLTDSQGRDKKSRRHITLDSILNFILRGTIHKYVYGQKDSYECSEEVHFDGMREQTAIVPSYYKVTSIQKEGFTNPDTRGLKNVKCYPIDLASQVDNDGNIFIDQDTNKPIDVKSVSLNDGSSTPEMAVSAIAAQNYIQQTIIFIVVFLVLLALGIALIIYILRAKSPIDFVPVETSLAPAIAIAAVTTAQASLRRAPAQGEEEGA